MDSLYQWERDQKLFAIEALHHSDRDDRGKFLLQLIVDDDPVVRGKTALAMEGLPDGTLLEAVDALLDQRETEYRILACELLGSTREADFSDRLTQLLRADDDRVIKAAIEVLDNLDQEPALSLLQDVVNRYRAEWSRPVKRLLNRWHPPATFAIIRELYPSAERSFKVHLLRIAAATNHEEAPDWIRERLENLDPADPFETVILWELGPQDDH
jgi:HEAT repeat protein